MPSVAYATMSDDAVQKFLASNEQLGKPLVFANNVDSFSSYLRATICIPAAILCFIPTARFPVQAFNPRKIAELHSLHLDNDNVTFHSAANDCCCHVANSTTVVPLTKIQDINVREGCFESCFGIKKLEIDSAGTNMVKVGDRYVDKPEIVATMLVDPDEARLALQHAIKLYKQRGMAPMQQTMTAPASSSMAERLARLEQLVQNQVLDAQTAAELKPKILTSKEDPTLKLQEAAQLRASKAISEQDFAAMRDALVTAVRGGST